MLIGILSIKTATLGAAKYRTTFKIEWSKLYPMKAVRNDKHSFYCVPCRKTIRCDHQGLKDVKDHCSTGSHKLVTKVAKTQPSVAGMFSMVCKNKTDSHSSLKLEGTLSNLLAMKLHYPEEVSPCFKFNPDENLQQRAIIR